jgi:ectoine hydroxylase-related dioxygenase (phytanoyl-CoA dioxygenase family)
MLSASMQEQSAVLHPRQGFALTAKELDSFQRDGYVGPFPLLDPRLCTSLAESLVAKTRRHPDLNRRSLRHKVESAIHAIAARGLGRPLPVWKPVGAPGYWYKSVHLLIPEAEELALRPEIVDRMISILGPDLLLWGVQLVAKKAGENHRWHADIEHVAWTGATAWLGLANINSQSTMQVIPKSHLFGVTPQELAKRQGARLESDSETLGLAQQMSPDARIVELDMKPGDFFIFSGCTWHASKNSSGRERVAMISQFSPTSAQPRIPCTYELPTPWYSVPPWVMLAAGEDRHGINHVQRRRR